MAARAPARPAARGFTLTDMMVSLAVTAVISAGLISYFTSNHQVTQREDLGNSMEASLRLGYQQVAFSVRNAGYGVPRNALASWVPWVSGFSSNPQVVTGSSASVPDSITTAACTSQSVATLAADASAGATVLTLSSTSGLDNQSRRLIMLGDGDSALIQSVNGIHITIDTDPTTAGNQGLSHAYLTGTPLCRVDVTTWAVSTSSQTLTQDLNQGLGPQPAMSGISNLKISVSTSGLHPLYGITLTAAAPAGLLAGNYASRVMSASVATTN